MSNQKLISIVICAFLISSSFILSFDSWVNSQIEIAKIQRNCGK